MDLRWFYIVIFILGGCLEVLNKPLYEGPYTPRGFHGVCNPVFCFFVVGYFSDSWDVNASGMVID